MLDKEVQANLIQAGRAFMKGDRLDDPYEELFESDQDQKKPQPPLVKDALRPEGEWIKLSLDFNALEMKNNLIQLLRDRRSSRVYTQEKMSLLQLSFLLWATQGVKSIRGKAYATLRTPVEYNI